MSSTCCDWDKVFPHIAQTRNAAAQIEWLVIQYLWFWGMLSLGRINTGTSYWWRNICLLINLLQMGIWIWQKLLLRLPSWHFSTFQGTTKRYRHGSVTTGCYYEGSGSLVWSFSRASGRKCWPRSEGWSSVFMSPEQLLTVQKWRSTCWVKFIETCCLCMRHLVSKNLR